LINPPGDSLKEGQSYKGHRYVGHAHFWERAMLSRRQFIGISVGSTGAVLSSGLWLPAVAHAGEDNHVAPRPIPGGIQPFGPGTEVFHVFLPEHGAEPSTIFDFNGFVGAAHLQGTGTGTDTSTGTTTPLVFDVDNRFMKGVYVGGGREKAPRDLRLHLTGSLSGAVCHANPRLQPGYRPEWPVLDDTHS
jgi:hypothetical protein